MSRSDAVASALLDRLPADVAVAAVRRQPVEQGGRDGVGAAHRSHGTAGRGAAPGATRSGADPSVP